MGKRRERTRGGDHNGDDSSLLPPRSSSDAMPCSSSGFVLSKKKKYSGLVESKESKPPGSSSSMDERSIKQLNAQMSGSHPRHNNLGQSIFLKRPRHGHQHSWRNSSNNFRASTSHGRSLANWDDRISFKLGGHYKSEDYGYAEAREKMLGIPERIRCGPTISEASFPGAMRLPCGLCHNSLWKQAVVAVLICGHLYHADCLERKTTPEDRSDPPCPICLDCLERKIPPED